MDHDQLFTEFNVGAARQISLSAKVMKAKDEEIDNLKAQLLLKETEAAKAIRLRAETSQLEALEKSLRDEVTTLNERNTILEKEHNALDVKVTDLQAIVVSKDRELTNSAANLLLSSLTMTTLLISKAIEKDMQDGLAAVITHGKEARVLTDVAAHNHAAEADYVSALQQLQSVNFPLLAELKTNKYASIEVVMNILRLEEHLAARSLFQDVFAPLAEPLSTTALTVMEGTSGAVPTTTDLTTALSVTLASASTVTPLSIDDYGFMGTDDQSAVDESVLDKNANPLPNVDDAELNIPQ
nr:hypothetical protein [Tanacetum cinerariifolium]